MLRATIASVPAASTEVALFSLDHVSLRHGEVSALRDLSLRFDSGSVTAVIGSSGSGKSTLLRLLIGLDRPDQGCVSIDGEPLRPEQHLALRRRVGSVTQDGGLFPHLTVLGNLALLPRHLGWSAARIEARAGELTQQMQLPQDLLRRYPAELSGGQRQRVAICRALMTGPAALLLDEPLGALDPLVRHELQAQLRGVFESSGCTVILVTHDLPEAAYLARRLVLLHEGAVVQDGSAQDLIERPASDFVRRFVAAHRGLPGTAS